MCGIGGLERSKERPEFRLNIFVPVPGVHFSRQKITEVDIVILNGFFEGSNSVASFFATNPFGK